MTQGSRLQDYTFIVLAIFFGAGSVLLLVIGEPIRIVHFNWSEQNILLWDTFLSLFFFAQHSITVRKFFRERVKMIFSSHYDVAIYATTSGIALTIVVLFWQRSQITLLNLQGIPRLVVSILNLLGVLLFILGASKLRPFDPLGIGPIRAHLREIIYKPGPFIIRGPYRWVRHPLYACILVMFWANPNLTTDQLLFKVLWSGWIIIATFLEERDLSREFGDVYLEYKKTVPMLIPWIIPHPTINK
jgi:protein-S-isoprenylcysteine O-methyltransferase Ste14